MAALLEGLEDPRAGTSAIGVPNSDSLTQGLYGSAATPVRSGGGQGSTIGESIKNRMPELVKGAGLRGKGGNAPLTNYTDIMTRSAQASMDLRMSTRDGFASKSAVVGSLNQGWLDQFGALKTALMQRSVMEEIADLVSLLPGGGDAVKAYAQKSFTAGNLGIGSVSGLVPSLGGFAE